MRETHIYLKVTSDYPEIFKMIEKFIDFINHSMEIQTQNKFYLEVVEDGLVYIYADLQTFKIIHQQFSKQQVLTFLENQEPVLPPEKIISNITSESFPKDGVTLNFIAQTEPKDQYILIKEAHLRSLLTEDVEVQINGSDNLSITFLTYDAILLYCKFLVAFFGGLSKF